MTPNECGRTRCLLPPETLHEELRSPLCGVLAATLACSRAMEGAEALLSRVATYSRVAVRRDTQLLHRKLTWLVLGGDPAARSHRVEQFTAL